MEKNAKERAAALLAEMTLEEKIYQVTADMIFEVDGEYEKKRNPMHGSYRNPGHFMHHTREKPAGPAEVTKQINEDVRHSIEAQPHSIPPIENGEALHGAQWGMCTNFPQPIGLASTFNPELVEEVACAIGRECAAAGVRQVFSPVVNIVRDCRWGRTVETYGEDVKLTGDMGAAMCRGLQKNGVIATPKHFADNYGAGGRDSNYSDTSERTMREVFLPPFKACFDAGAQSVMAAYNAWDGVPCSANRRLLTGILRDEWGFEGFVVSDYSGVEGIYSAHRCAENYPQAAAKALKEGLDVILPYDSYGAVLEAVEKGYITEKELDRNVLRVLTAKFSIGLFDGPYKNPDEAEKTVRCDEHKALALKAARQAVILLKNNGVLPLKKDKIKKIGVFGQSANLIPIGSNYSGPYGTPWQGDDAPAPIEALREFLGDTVQVVFADSAEIEKIAPQCDANIYFTSIIEGEGSDRSSLKLPDVTQFKNRDGEGGLIVDAAKQAITDNQERSIKKMFASNACGVVVLQNGAPVDMTGWIDDAGAVIESWYPGEQGARAVVEILFGITNPSAKLPLTIPKSVGQLPLYYSYKPSGRDYAYCDSDGKPLYPFGFGLSYTEFEIINAAAEACGGGVEVEFDIKNTGCCDGAQVVQLYLGTYNCGVARPLKELKAYKRVELKKGETRKVALRLEKEDFAFYDEEMRFGTHNARHRLMLGTSSDDIICEFEAETKNGKITVIQ